MTAPEWETSIVQRDGLVELFLRNCGRTITIDFGSPDPTFTIHGLLDFPIARIADPELIPHLVGALRSVLGALEAL